MKTTIPPVASPVERCAWCWPVLHPGVPYPGQWSSTICAEHSAWILAKHAVMRSTRRPMPLSRNAPMK